VRRRRRGTAHDDAGPDGTQTRGRPQIVLVGVVALAVILAGGGLVWATRLKSPASVAAETAPPPRTLLTAPVTRQSISASVVFRGQVSEAQQLTATPVAAAGLLPRVTATPVPVGGQVTAGSVIVEVSGRPLVALPGEVPAYRDLVPGSQGKDVSAVQKALRELGFASGRDLDGVFGAGTEEAVSAFYGHLGYSVPTAGDPTALTAARETVTQAERALTTVEDSGEPTDEESGAAAGGGAQAGGVPLATRLTWARQDLVTARATYAGLAAASGPMLPAAEIVILPTLPAVLSGLSAGVGGSVTDPLVTISSGTPVVTGRLDPSDASRVRAGLQVTVSDQTTGFRGTGTVTGVGALVPPKDGSTSYLPVAVTGVVPPRSLIGQDVALQIEAAGSGAVGLAVPLAAVFSRADGDTYVSIERSGTVAPVAVHTGAVGDGRVAVVPDDPSALVEGDEVVLGTDAPSEATGVSPGAGEGTGSGAQG
jgi:HlyD family secretion protein